MLYVVVADTVVVVVLVVVVVMVVSTVAIMSHPLSLLSLGKLYGSFYRCHFTIT